MKKFGLLFLVIAIAGVVMTRVAVLSSSEATVEPTEFVEPPTITETAFGEPIDQARSRVTKKTFGLWIDPEHSPIEHDRFTGYHVGVDFETFADEQDADVSIFAICDGELIIKQFAKGYGGVAVQACELEGQDVTIIYGHLDLASVKQEVGQIIERGEQIAVLGQGESEETDGVRKHLHLGVHRGVEIDLRGYVQDLEEIENWLDVLSYMP